MFRWSTVDERRYEVQIVSKPRGTKKYIESIATIAGSDLMISATGGGGKSGEEERRKG